ncbi:MAG: radical SAM protein [Nitrospirota bacterium]
MNILIISTNRSKQPVPVMPLGACIVAESAERAGHRVRLLDLMFCQDLFYAIDSELKRSKPDLIGLSVRNIDNNDMKNPVEFFRDLPGIIESIRCRTEAPIVLGGSAISVMPEELLHYSGVSVAVLGDGEVVFPELLRALSNGEDLNRVSGIATLENNILTKNPRYQSQFSNGCLIPDFYHWLDVDVYLSSLSTVPIQSKRGCPYQCIYCTYPMGEGRDYRLCHPESVVEAIKKSAPTGLRDFEFVDNVFNSPRDHAIALCERLSRERLNVRLQSLELNPLFIDDELLSVMEHAGFVGIGVTVESASDTVLNGLRKNFNGEHVYHAAHVIHRHKLPCLWIFMFGGPGETKETVRETFTFAERCIGPGDVAFFNVGIRIYPGTELEQLARKQGLLELPQGEMLKPVFYISPTLDIEWLMKELKAAMSTHMNYLSTDSLSLSYLSCIHRIGYRLGIQPPLWKHTRFIRRGLRFFGADA